VGARPARRPKPHLAQRQIHIVVDYKKGGRRDGVTPQKLGHRLAGKVHKREGTEKEFFSILKNLAPRKDLFAPGAAGKEALQDPKA